MLGQLLRMVAVVDHHQAADRLFQVPAARVEQVL
jgi:hypothetical protein